MNNSLVLKKLDQKIKSSKSSFCPSLDDCFRRVAEGKTITFFHVIKGNAKHLEMYILNDPKAFFFFVTC